MSKNIVVTTVFNEGSKIDNKIVIEDASKYASLQSKACTKRTNLQAKIALNKISAEDAQEDWNRSVVEPWKNMVRDTVVNSYPEAVRPMIVDILPATNMLDLHHSAE